MKKLIYKKHNFILLLFLTTNIFGFGSEESNIIEKFLKNDHEAYMEIVSNPDKFKNAILEKLKFYKDFPDELPNSLLYIACILKDERYLPYFIKLIHNKEYSYSSCVYSCPIVFTLTIYSCFTKYSLPKLNTEFTSVKDLYYYIERVKKIKLISEDAGNYIKGPGIDSDIKIGKTLDINKLIKLAGPKNDSLISRFAVAYMLKYRLIDIKYLPDLYWLVITEYGKEAFEYRSAIYWAIFKTETVKLKENNQ